MCSSGLPSQGRREGAGETDRREGQVVLRHNGSDQTWTMLEAEDLSTSRASFCLAFARN